MNCMSKCTFATNQVNYLGHVISYQGVSTDPSKIKDVMDWPEPDNATKLRGFLGLTGYYIRFVKDYGKICRLYMICSEKIIYSGNMLNKLFTL